jgi:DnaJ-class molecular chaperone
MTAWNYHSNVTACPDCEGSGYVHSHRRATIDDPYPENRCECGLGEHNPECAVCGFNQVVAGYDCLACDTVAALTDSDFADFAPGAFAEAVKVAVIARMNSERRAAA